MNKGICTRMVLTNMALENQALGGGGPAPPPMARTLKQSRQSVSNWNGSKLSGKLADLSQRAVGSELPQRVVQLVPSWAISGGLTLAWDPHAKLCTQLKQGKGGQREREKKIQVLLQETTVAGISKVWTLNSNLIPKFSSGLSCSAPPLCSVLA